MSILALPHPVLWQIIEYYLKANTQNMAPEHRTLYNRAICARSDWAWYNYVRISKMPMYADIEGGSESFLFNVLNPEKGSPHTFTLVSLLRSVCKNFKRCIDMNTRCKYDNLYVVPRSYILNL